MERHALITTEHKDRPGWIYGLTHPAWPGHVKVGKTASPRRRLANYNCGCPHQMYQMVFQFEVDQMDHAEAMAHTILENYRVPGRAEWFTIHPQDALNLIRNLSNGGS